MKRIYAALFLSMLFSLGSGAFALENSDQQTYLFSDGDGQTQQLHVRFFAHNQPSISQFLAGKAMVNGILAKIAKYGFKPKVESLSIGISPDTMNGGDVVQENGNLYISLKAGEEEVESRLLRYFYVKTTDGKIHFFPHNGATLDQLAAGRRLVKKVLTRFKDNGLTLQFPEGFQVGISPATMYGGDVVQENGIVYVSITSSEDQVERFFTKFLVR